MPAEILNRSGKATASERGLDGQQQSLPRAGRQRTVIEGLSPEINGGRFAIKRSLGDTVVVEADIFSDGHEVLSAVLKFRHAEDRHWTEAALLPLVNDRWRGRFSVSRLGTYFYTLEAWVDRFGGWRRALEKKADAQIDVTLELVTGVELLKAAMQRAPEPERSELHAAADALAPGSRLSLEEKLAVALSQKVRELMETHSERLHVTRYAHELRVCVEPVLARYGAWYEMFPRSCAAEPGRHGTLQDCEKLLPHIAKMGFDVVYLPPVHPIGESFRKGRNNSLTVAPGDPGSPWAIGSAEGGHKAVHPQLGTLEDFRSLVRRAEELRLAVALDIAFQCSPNHPWVREHPEWFSHRPDGSIQYAENPPKKYQDIYPLNFETQDWRALWLELMSVFEFWVEQGVKVFRVDNPHTKPFKFWEWCLGELKAQHPELIFLSEAFTRPKLMYYLAKLGFSQSYNYFPWRNTKRELISYFQELAQSGVRQFFRPNLWPNTPDILTEYLQFGGRPAFITRLVLAATLGASYGVYGPPYEVCERLPREPGSEEYLNSEKYEIRHWVQKPAHGLGELMARLNQIRRDNPSLRSDDSLQFHAIDNEQLLAYSKCTEDFENVILVVVNLDPKHKHSGWLTLAAQNWGLPPTGNYQVHELLTNERFIWSGPRNFVELDPQFVPAHVFRLRRYIRTEQDFDYFV